MESEKEFKDKAIYPTLVIVVIKKDNKIMYLPRKKRDDTETFDQALSICSEYLANGWRYVQTIVT